MGSISGSAAVESASVGSPSGHLDQVLIVFKTHFDIGYTDMASNVVQRYRTTMIDQALDVVDANRPLPPEQQFVWTLPGWPLRQILADWDGQTPERQRRIQQAFREGRFVTHALPFTTHTEWLELEDLVRGLGYASTLSRDAGLALPRDAKMTDVPCHSWILPTLLRHAGVDFLHLGCNAASQSPQVPRLFWWEGPDGSRLLTMYTAESYGTGLVPPPDWPHRSWLALIHTGDNHGPPTPDEVAKLLGEARAKLPGVRVRIGRLSDFADAILAGRPHLPVVRGDMPDTWIHGPMSDPQGARLAREIRPQIAMAEALDTLLPLWGVSPPTAGNTIRRAYEQSLLYGEHTWGGAYWWIYGKYLAHYGDKWRAERAAGRFDRIESSWAEHTGYIESADRLLSPLLANQMRTLAQAVSVDGDRVLVFNPLPWRRTHGIAVANLSTTVFGTAATGQLESPEQGPSARYDVADGHLRFSPSWVPPLGYATLRRSSLLSDPGLLPKLDQSSPVLDSGLFKARLDQRRGAITSLVVQEQPGAAARLPAGREAVDTNAPFGFGQVLYERFDSNQVAAFVRDYVKINVDWATNELGKPCLPPAEFAPYVAASPEGDTADYHISGFSVDAMWRAPASERVPFGVSTRFLFYHDTPFFDLEVTLEKKPADPWPEAAWLCLPFAVESPRFRLGRLGSIVDPAADLVPGANHHLYAIDTGLAVIDPEGRGFGVCPLDSPLVSLGTPGCWKYSTRFVPGKATVFINLFNNQWTTNFRLWNEGTWTSRVRIWPIDRYDPFESLVRPALEARFPLQAVCATGPGGKSPTSASGLSLGSTPSAPHASATDSRDGDRSSARVTAFGPNPDGPGTLLRLWETAGRTGDCPVHLPRGLEVTHAQPLDLRDRPIGLPIPIHDGVFQAPLRAFAPATFRLETPDTRAQERAALARRILADPDLSDVLARARELLKTGFNAGSGYREVWIRDLATFIEVSCDVLERDDIRENLRLFFLLQGDDGNIVDGFVHRSQANVGYRYIKRPGAPDYWGHKNTVETDQETSLVHAVRIYAERTGDRAFLDEVIEGQTVRQRLGRALDYLLEHRFSPPHGMLWGATTVDWGDVQPEHEWGVELDASSHRTVDIYDNAMFVLALRDYRALLPADAPDRARWEQLEVTIRRNIRQHLWDPAREQFKPHLYLEGSPFPADFDESQVYYHGGTAVAILAGLLEPAEIRASLARMCQNVRDAGAGTLGLTVYPPYPAGTFKNPSMVPWSYQNGGDWDWFGGRMIQALVEHGFVEDAYLELVPMVRRVQRSDGFFEWFDRDNRPRGSGTFRGAAGVLGKAILMLQEWARENR